MDSESKTSASLLVDKIPSLIATLSSDFVSTPDHNNFLRGCKWSPDGTCLLTASQDNCLRVFELDIIRDVELAKSSSLAALVMQEPEIIYDYCWYPGMSSDDPSTCCVAAASRDCPVHLWDAYSGMVRCSYIPYNHLQEIHAPYSLCFSSDGSKLICGMKHYIKYFHTAIPGSFSINVPLSIGKKQIPNNIVSALATRPSKQHEIIFGTFGGNVGLIGEDGQVQFLLEAQPQGVTHVKISSDEYFLIVGARKNNEIIIWDLRYPSDVFARLSRLSPTSQRIYFDVDPVTNLLASGNQDGTISLWDEITWKSPGAEENLIKADWNFLAHQDSVNGVCIHPKLGLLGSVSGEKKFFLDFSLENEEEDIKIVTDNCIKVWEFYK